jgi:site-specific DNA recombinase
MPCWTTFPWPRNLNQIASGDPGAVHVQEFESQKLLLNEKISNCGHPLPDYDETFRTAMEFLASPCKLWASERLEDRRAVLKLAFAENLAYVPKEGFRTAEFSFPFRTLQDFSGSKREMAHPTGFEPVTPAFGASTNGSTPGCDVACLCAVFYNFART